MQAVREIVARAVPLDRSDVDTDQIIPSDWLKRVERTGFGEGLFSDGARARTSSSTSTGSTAADPRRRPQLRDRIVGEHAPWALRTTGSRR